MEKPIEFIITDKGRSTLRVSPEAIQILKKVNKPLKVVSVAGNYRTGKSFLLNRLMNRNDGFPLGSTVKSKTKGIWMWIGDHPNDPSKALLLLDTEGLNDVEKADRSHDAQIFTLAILLSSILVYNSVGAIGAEALEGLHVASELSKHIQTKQESSLEFATFFPAFIWAVRDFHLILEDDEGNDLTENQYLEMSLDVKPGITGSRDFTAIKQAIRDHFPKRDCFTFLPPASFKKMGRLETLKESELDEDFLETGQKFADFIIQSKAFFQLKGEVLRGQSFAILAEHYTKLINEGSINLQSAHDYMIMSMNSGAIATAMKKFKTFLDNLNMPLSPDNFFKAYAEQREILFSEFRAECVNLGDHPKFKEEFDNQFLSLAKEYQTENCKVSEAICQEKLDEYYEAIDTKLKATQYHKPGGYHDLMKDLGCMEEKYRALGEQREMGPKYSDVRMEFWDKKIIPLMNTIRQSDEQLTAAERATQEAESQKREAEYRAQKEQESRQRSEANQKTMEEAHKKEMEDMTVDLKKAMEEQNRAHKIAMENSKAEQKRQLEEHREQEAQLRREDAERGQRQMDILNRRHHEQLEAIREEAASSSSRWRDIGNVVGQVAGGIASRYIPGPMGYATRF